MPLTLASLLATPTADDIKAKLLASLNVVGFPITDWLSGGVARTLTEMVAAALRDFVGVLTPRIAGGGILDTAEGDWLTLLVEQLYEMERREASYTEQRMVLTDDGGTGPHTINAGDVIVEANTGNRYINTTGGTLLLGGTLVLTFKAESPGGSYADPGGTVTRMVTTIAGVTVDNPDQDFSPVAQTGIGPGTVTPSAPGGAGTATAHTFVIKILSSGQVGAATWSYSMDGAEHVSGGTVVATYDLPGGTRVAFANHGTFPVSFVLGDLYTFTTPGSPITVQGQNIETDEELRERARARWPDLSLVPTETKYATWAKAASVQVTKVTATPDLAIPGQVNVKIAGNSNPLSVDVVNLVQAYVNDRADITDKAVVTAAATELITPAGTVTVRAADLAAVQAAAQTAWSTYIQTIPIAGVVRVAELAQAVMDAGAVDFTALLLNGAASVQLGDGEVATITGGIDTQLTWSPLP